MLTIFHKFKLLNQLKLIRVIHHLVEQMHNAPMECVLVCRNITVTHISDVDQNALSIKNVHLTKLV